MWLLSTLVQASVFWVKKVIFSLYKPTGLKSLFDPLSLNLDSAGEDSENLHLPHCGTIVNIEQADGWHSNKSEDIKVYVTILCDYAENDKSSCVESERLALIFI